ncbi:MAG: hypothetical protein ABI880_01045 [Acidobacteriota bacterium]
MTAALVRVGAAIGLALATWSCGGSGGGMRAPRAIEPPAAAVAAARPPLEGEWRLVSMQMADGASRRVTGFLRVDRFANLTVRAALAADEPAARAPQTVVAAFTAKAVLVGDVLDYTGLNRDVGSDQLTPDAVEMGAWRYVELDGQTLRLSVRDRGGRAAATLVFQRVP